MSKPQPVAHADGHAARPALAPQLHRLRAVTAAPAGAILVRELKHLPRRSRAAMGDRLAALYCAVWGDGTEEYRSVPRAREVIEARCGREDEALFVAIDAAGGLAGTAAIGHDDYYEGFSRAAGVAGCVGRDLYVSPAHRGRRYRGLKVWEQLFEAWMGWLSRRGESGLTLYTEPGPKDLPALYASCGAVVVKQGIDHRALGAGCITVMRCEAGDTLARLAQRRRAFEVAAIGDLRARHLNT